MSLTRAAIRDEGYDPDDPTVIAALDRVRAELAAVGRAVDRWLRSPFCMSLEWPV
jgi:hypothetical protein